MIKILHIDDDQIEFEILYVNLTNLAEDFKISWAETGDKALEMMRAEAFDCVLCDFQMPIMNGFEILGKAKEQGINSPFIFLTAQGNQEIAVEAFRAGAEDYYTKEESFAHYDRLVSRIRKIVEKEYEIRNSQTILKNVLDSLPGLICVYDSDLKVVMSNWASRLSDFKECMGKKGLHELLWGESCHCKGCPVEQVFLSGQPSLQVKHNLKGHYRDVRVSVYPVFDNRGKVKFVTEHIQNIENLSSAETPYMDCSKAISLSEELLVSGSWFRSLTEGTFYMSSEMRSIFEITEGEDYGSFFEVLQAKIHPDDLNISESVGKGLLHDAFEFRIRTSRGIKWLHSSPLKILSFNENNEPIEIFGAIQDITERKEFENQLAHSNSRLSIANEELESFAFTVSHDLRSPLRHIRGYLDIFRKDFSEVLGDQGNNYLEKLTKSANRMDMLIEDILLLSRATRVELEKENIDLSEIAKEIVEDLQAGDPDRKAEISIEKELFDFADKKVISIILTNLLHNAWKFSKNEEVTQIAFTLEENEGEKIYLIQDNGAGFSQAYADDLFVAFKRFHSQNKFPGTGIGLATVKRMLQKHGGSIYAEGEEGVGSKFYFTLNDE